MQRERVRCAAQRVDTVAAGVVCERVLCHAAECWRRLPAGEDTIQPPSRMPLDGLRANHYTLVRQRSSQDSTPPSLS